MRYELFYLIGASKEAELEKIKGEVKELVSALGGIFEEKETEEKRKTSYKIKQEIQGIYVAQRFELPEAENIKEINRKMNLNHDVLRFIISRADELPELKTKEERIREAEGKQVVSETRKEAAPKKEKKIEEVTASASPKETRPVETSQEEKKITKLEDIDDKLEEILNI